MGAKRIVGIALLLAAAGLGAAWTSRELNHRAAASQADRARVEADQIRGRWQAEQHRLEARLQLAANAKPLLAALDNHVDGATLVDLFQSEDWWRDARGDFSLARVVVGSEVLATTGGPDPGTNDRPVVARARAAEGVASSLVTLDGKPYFLLATRLGVLTGQDPVLVVERVADRAVLGTMIEPAPVAGRTAADLGIVVLAAVLAGLGAMLVIFGGGPRAAGGDASGVPAPARREPTLRIGATRAHAAPPVRGDTAGALKLGSAITPLPAAVPFTSVPPPRAVAATPQPAGPPRHATSPDGTPLSETGAARLQFGRYQLLDRLGEGGMSEVFTAASHGVEGFSRVFVLKRLRQELAADKEAIGQFIDEARMQASLVHSNIVPVFDFGQVGSEFFMTQEYIVGRDLVRLIARCYEHSRDSLSPRLAYYAAHETLLALQYAHTKADREGQPMGIVHRDVSPANIIMSAQGEVKLSDFGIVKSKRRVTRTQAGMVKGNVNFMSPEQARGGEVDARSDLFSMGLVLYYCLTNRFLYDGDNDLDVLFKAACGPTAEHQERIDRLPSPAREVLGLALAVDPKERFQSAAEFADSLTLHIGGAKAEAAHLMQLLFGEELRREAA
jgi:hypothetical protein